MKINFIYFLVGIFYLKSCSAGIGFTDVLTSGVNTGKAIGGQITKVIPTPEELFNTGKQALLGYPFQAAASAINYFCSLAVNGNGTSPRFSLNASQLSFVLFTDSENITIPLLESEKLWTHPSFNKDLKVTLFITGWTTDLTEQDTTIDTMLTAYRTRGNYNFLALDPAKFIDTLYTWSAFNTEEIGEYVGYALAKLVEYVSLDKIHVIGHSLGAQISGSAARSFNQKTGKLLKRVTGLDPANPCFNEGEILSGIQRGDAEFIDVIHTNVGVLGKKHPTGDADFYPNGVQPLQPGCLIVPCAHARAWKYYAESVNPAHENDFLSLRCNSLNSLNSGLCKGKKIPMGFNVPLDAKGNYFLATNSDSPYGKIEN